MSEAAPPPNSALNPESWVDEHGDYLLGYAMNRLRNRARAEDAVQEALIAAFKGQDRFEGRSSERTWLTGILKYKCLEAMRKNWREIAASDLTTDDDDVDFDERGHLRPGHAPESFSLEPGASIDKKEFYDVLNSCLTGLPERTAQAFVAAEIDQEPLDGVAQTLNVSMNNLYVLLHRARKTLRGCLEKTWFSETDANPAS